MAQSPPLVPDLLPAPVLLGGSGATVSVLLPVVGMLLTPFAGAIAADVAVLGIGGDLGAVIITAPLALAIGLATDFLTRLELGRPEGALAISAAPQIHTGVVASGTCRCRRC
ncbi:MAG: hypothetical protein KJZ78_12075 [Bryobacteraceae bacterium]|nr:hypothetical protein [Bryobacteraceae bacterium]